MNPGSAGGAAGAAGAPGRGTVGAWRRAGLFAGPAVFGLIAFAPSALHRIEGYGSRPAFAAAVTAWMALWWFTEAVPIHWTALLPLALFPLLGVYGGGVAGDALESAAPYVDPYIFLFLGGMAIGAAMEQWQLHRRVALVIMRAVGTAPRRLLLGMLLATASVSLWISNTATAVMMLPIGMALLAQLEAARGGRKLLGFGSAVMLGIAYAANLGGIGTKIGTATNSIFAGFVSEKLGRDIGFLEYMGVGLPLVVLLLPVVWWALWRVARTDDLGAADGREVIDRELAALGPMSGRERAVGAVFLAAASLWILGDPLRRLLTPHVPALWDGFRFQGKHYEASVAMLAGLVLLGTRTLGVAGLRRIPWSTLLLLGGSFAMAAGIEGSGLSRFLAVQLAAVRDLPLFGQILLASVATIAVSALASNTATVNLMLNVLPPSTTVLTASALAASCDFALPAGTPPNAIVFGSGYVRLPTMMRVGVQLDLVAALVIAVYAWVWVPLVLGP